MNRSRFQVCVLVTVIWIGVFLGCCDNSAQAEGTGVEAGTQLCSGCSARVLAKDGVGGVKENKKSRSKPVRHKRDYSLFLKDPKKLGFKPGEYLFRNIYYHIKTSFVEDVPDDKLLKSLKNEVANLLKQAKVSTAGLARLDPHKKVLPQLIDMYGDKVDRHLLVYAAILGMLDGLDDRYTILMRPEEYAKLQEQMQSREFGGVGIYIELDREHGNQLTVFEPIEGTPAYKAGLESGDRIIKIDGKDTKGITLDMAQAAIRGPVGSTVVLTVERKSSPRPIDFVIKRGLIHVVSVSSKMLEGGVGYIRLRLFGSQTTDELNKALERLKHKGMRGLILDLRNNGGGYIDAAVGVVGDFIGRNGLVVYTVNRSKRRRDYRSRVDVKVKVPVVVLVNRFSASASEITAGALRDHKVAVLVGEKTFGKGSVQQLYPFPDGSALKMTIAKFYTPSGGVINKIGLKPDVPVKMEPRFVGRKGKDIQLRKAVEVLKSRLLQSCVLPCLQFS